MNREQHRNLQEYLDSADITISAVESLNRLVDRLFNSDEHNFSWELKLPNNNGCFYMPKRLTSRFLLEMRDAMLEEMNQIETPVLGGGV